MEIFRVDFLQMKVFLSDGKVYALAQGALTIGGFDAGGASGSAVRKNHGTTARVPSGAIVERDLGWGAVPLPKTEKRVRQPFRN